jgi:hypothetical protein
MREDSRIFNSKKISFSFEEKTNKKKKPVRVFCIKTTLKWIRIEKLLASSRC